MSFRIFATGDLGRCQTRKRTVWSDEVKEENKAPKKRKSTKKVAEAVENKEAVEETPAE